MTAVADTPVDPRLARVPEHWPKPPGALARRVRRLRSDPFALGLLLLVVLHVLLRAWTAAGFSFWQDDYVYVERASQGLTWDYLLQDYGGHLQAGQFLLVWALTRWAPLDYGVAMTVTIALGALAVLLLARLLVVLFGRRVELLVPVAVFALSPLAVNGTLWWAAALQVVPLQLALIGTVYCHVEHLRTGRARWAVAEVAVYAAGLLFWEKALLIAPLLVGLTLLLRRPGDAVLSLAPFRRHLRLWVALVGVSLGYLALYLARTQTPLGDSSAVVDVATTARYSLVDTFLVALLGGPWRAEGDAPLSQHAPPYGPVLVLVVAVAVAVVAASVLLRGWHAVRVWLLLLGYLSLDVGLVAVARTGLFGVDIGRDPRFTTDALPVAALCLALALLPSPLVPGSARRRRALPGGWDVQEARPLVVGLVLVAYAGSCIVSTSALAEQARRLGPADYVDTLRESLRAEPGAVLLDGPVSPAAMTSLLGDDATLSTVVAALPEAPRFDEPAERPLMADLEGRLHPVEVLDPVVAPVGPKPQCGYEVNGPVGERLPLDATGVAVDVVRLTYLSGSSVRATVAVGGRRVDVVLLRGLHQLHVPVTGPVRGVGIEDLPGSAELCVTEIVAGRAAPRAPAAP